MSQNIQASSSQAVIDSQNKQLKKRMEAIVKEKELLEKDHDDMIVLHERQTIELENLLQNQQKLKQQNRQVRGEVGLHLISWNGQISFYYHITIANITHCFTLCTLWQPTFSILELKFQNLKVKSLLFI